MQDNQASHTNDEKVVVITGASSGIGMATAFAFAETGYNVVLAARRKVELDAVAKECEIRGALTHVVETDTTSDEAVHKLGEEAVRIFGKIDVWVNNAGVYLAGKFEDIPLEDMKRVIDTNFFGYVHGSHTALQQFRKQEHGTLINVSSVNASAPQPYVGIYSASKAAVRALDESLRMELRLDNKQARIHVCTVMPASIDTNLFKNAANYTGQELQAIEPVYDPAYVAKQIVGLTKRPRRELIVGAAGKFMAMQNAHTPGMYERHIASYTDKNLLDSTPTVPTAGNLFQSSTEHGQRGGWRSNRMAGDQLNVIVASSIAAAVGIIGLAVLTSRKQKPKPTRGIFGTLFK